MGEWTADVLIALTGLILSLGAFYVPVFRRWQESLGEWTPLFMAVVLLIVSIGRLLWVCQLQAACIQANWLQALLVFLAALGANQGTYLAAVKPVKRAEARAQVDDRLRDLMSQETGR